MRMLLVPLSLLVVAHAAFAAQGDAPQARGIATPEPRAATPLKWDRVAQQSCNAYPWYRKCKTESPLSYCCSTIRYDVPNCICN